MMIEKSIGIHNGAFHADEVTACALLVLFDLADETQIIRTRNLQKLALCEYVCDVGGVYDPSSKRFDHHQIDYKGELSSAGMVLLYLLDQKKLDRATYDFLNSSLIAGVDAHDNGRITPEFGVCNFSQIISNFVPVVYDAHIQDLAFYKAFTFVKEHLKRLLERFCYIQTCREKVAHAMTLNQKYLFFEEAMPWMESFFELGGEKYPALFVIMPSLGHWKLRGIPPCMEKRMQVRLPFPEEWAGLLEEEFKKISSISGAIFCHKERFISVWKTKEDAFKALEYMLNKVLL
ncbi:MAG: MYG1 family protein [Chlamydiales bacterium]|nr:MYG1 family protein [Chlamydiales bacterium]